MQHSSVVTQLWVLLRGRCNTGADATQPSFIVTKLFEIAFRCRCRCSFILFSRLFATDCQSALPRMHHVEVTCDCIPGGPVRTEFGLRVRQWQSVSHDDDTCSESLRWIVFCTRTHVSTTTAALCPSIARTKPPLEHCLQVQCSR